VRIDLELVVEPGVGVFVAPWLNIALLPGAAKRYGMTLYLGALVTLPVGLAILFLSIGSSIRALSSHS